MPKKNSAHLVIATRFLMYLTMGFLLSSCETTVDPPPPSPPEEQAYISISSFPDWVEAPWTLTGIGNTFTGVGDSILVMDKSGQYKFYGENGDNLIREPFQMPLVGEVDFGDTLSFHLDYAQSSWGRLYPETGYGAWHDIFPLEHGGALVCGDLDKHPRVAILDRNGQLVMNETDPIEGCYYKIISLGQDGFLLGGHDDRSIILSARNPEGEEIWNTTLDLAGDHTFGDLIPNRNGGYLLLTNTCNETPLIYPTLAILDGGGQLISQHDMVGPLHQVGLAISPRSSGGYFFLRARLIEESATHYANEMLFLDNECNVEQILEPGTESSGFYASSLACADGGVIFTFQDHGNFEGIVTTHVVRLSDSGQTLWQIQLEIEGIQVLNVCEESSDGHFLLAGNSFTGTLSDKMTWLVELNSSGEVLRNKQSSAGSTYIRISAAKAAWDGGVFTAGQYGHYTSGSAVAWVNRSQDNWFFEPVPD